MEVSIAQRAFMFKEAMVRFEITHGARTSRSDAMTYLFGYVADIAEQIARNAKQAALDRSFAVDGSVSVPKGLSYGIDYYLADQNLYEVLGQAATDEALGYARALFGNDGVSEFTSLLQDALRSGRYINRVKVVYVAPTDTAPSSIHFA